MWTPHRDPLAPELLDLPTKEEVLQRPKWPDIISTYVGTPFNMEETRDQFSPNDTDEAKEKKKRSPFRRDKGYVGYARRDDGKYKTDDGKPQTAEEHFAKVVEARAVELAQGARAPHGVPRRPGESAARSRTSRPT